MFHLGMLTITLLIVVSIFLIFKFFSDIENCNNEIDCRNNRNQRFTTTYEIVNHTDYYHSPCGKFVQTFHFISSFNYRKTFGSFCWISKHQQHHGKVSTLLPSCAIFRVSLLSFTHLSKLHHVFQFLLLLFARPLPVKRLGECQPTPSVYSVPHLSVLFMWTAKYHL